MPDGVGREEPEQRADVAADEVLEAATGGGRVWMLAQALSKVATTASATTFSGRPET